MRQSDLELYRWKVHHVTNFHCGRKNNLSMRQWWKEYGAFISVLPRQSGKTSMLKTLINSFSENGEQYMVLVGPNSMRDHLVRNHNIPKEKIITSHAYISKLAHKPGRSEDQDVNLLIDEFMFISSSTINTILDSEWKTVTMVSSFHAG